MCVIRSIWQRKIDVCDKVDMEVLSCRQMQGGRQVGSERDIVRLIALTDTQTDKISTVSEREEKRERDRERKEEEIEIERVSDVVRKREIDGEK